MTVNGICDRAHCGRCCRGCCAGCGMPALTREEAEFLLTFAELPFQPLASRGGGELPEYAYRGDAEEKNVRPDVILALAAKGLIRANDDLPLVNYDYRGFEDYPLHGSMALTDRGRQALDRMLSPWPEDRAQEMA